MHFKFILFYFIAQFASNAAMGQYNHALFSERLDDNTTPLTEMLSYDGDDLLEYGFKYYEKDNLYFFEYLSSDTKLNNLIAKTNVNGEQDYYIRVEMRNDDIAKIVIYFYHFFLYKSIETWIYDNIDDIYEIGDNKNKFFEFKKDSLQIRLKKETKTKYYEFHSIDKKKLFDNNAFAYSRLNYDPKLSKKKFFSEYTYTVLTGLVPNSPWYEEQQRKIQNKKNKKLEKKRKREAKKAERAKLKISTKKKKIVKKKD